MARGWMRALGSRARVAACLVLALGSGCLLANCGGTQDPCADDRFNCEDDDSGFQLDPSCQLDGDLVVRVGSGEEGFEPLERGQHPPIISGSQGGQHTILGVRVENPALDRYDLLRVELGMFPASQCPTGAAGEPLECEGDPPGGSRSIVLGEMTELEPTPEGWVEEHGMVLFLDLSTSELVIQAIVEDPCGRRGIAQHPISL